MRLQAFRVEPLEHGVLIFWDGPGLPIDAFKAVTTMASELGWDRFGSGQPWGAQLAFTNEASSAAFRAAGEQRAVALAGGDDERAWLFGPDTGISSLSIFAVLASTPKLRAEAAAKIHSWPDVPHDPSDYSRCRSLLARFPSWRARLGEVADAYPRVPWRAYSAAWDEMEALWLEESPTGSCRKLYALMSRLQGREERSR